MVIAGTSAQTSLPWQLVQRADNAGAIRVNIDRIGDSAARSSGAIRGPAADARTTIIDALISRLRAGRSPCDWAGCARCALMAAIR